MSTTTWLFRWMWNAEWIYLVSSIAWVKTVIDVFFFFFLKRNVFVFVLILFLLQKLVRKNEKKKKNIFWSYCSRCVCLCAVVCCVIISFLFSVQFCCWCCCSPLTIFFSVMVPFPFPYYTDFLSITYLARKFAIIEFFSGCIPHRILF